MRRLALAGLLVVAGCGQGGQPAGVPLSSESASTPTSSEAAVSPGLSAHGKDVIARAKQAGVAAVGLTVSTEPGATDRAAEALRGLGATVEAADSTIGYLRLSVPVGLAERVPSVEGVRQVDVDEPLSNADPTP